MIANLFTHNTYQYNLWIVDDVDDGNNLIWW